MHYFKCCASGTKFAEVSFFDKIHNSRFLIPYRVYFSRLTLIQPSWFPGFESNDRYISQTGKNVSLKKFGTLLPLVTCSRVSDRVETFYSDFSPCITIIWLRTEWENVVIVS